MEKIIKLRILKEDVEEIKPQWKKVNGQEIFKVVTKNGYVVSDMIAEKNNDGETGNFIQSGYIKKSK